MASHSGAYGDAAAPSGTDAARVPIGRALVVTGIVTPYTHMLYEELAVRHGVDLHVFACSPAEPGRLWQLPAANAYSRRTLRGLRWHRNYVSHLYFNPEIAMAILRLRPDVVLVSDFSPTMIFAAAAARLRGIPVAITSDTQPATDPGRSSWAHRLARRAIAPLISAAIGGSAASLEVFRLYRIGDGRMVVCPLAPAWQQEGSVPERQDRPYDLLFSGLVDDRWKGGRHFLETVRVLHRRGRRPRIRIVGEGPLLPFLKAEIAALGLEARFDGYLQQSQLAAAYGSAKLLLFPSRGDTWGLVANEAAQCGTPVLISPHAQAAYGLVERFGTGEVLPLDPERWADAALRYLDDEALWQGASRAGIASAAHFSLANAADTFMLGLRMACDGAAPPFADAEIPFEHAEAKPFNGWSNR